MKSAKTNPLPTESAARLAYKTELRNCFIIRMSDELRHAIELHGAWLAKQRGRDVSLASACRDLLRSGVFISPEETRERRRQRAAFIARRQLDLFDPRCIAG